MLRRACHYFTTQEKLLWCASVGAILLSFFLLEDTRYLRPPLSSASPRCCSTPRVIPWARR